MKHYSHIFIVLAIICIAFTSCKKGEASNMKTISLTAADSGSTITAVKGQTITVTLSNPGDGGYQFNHPQFNVAILKLASHNHINPVNSNAVGNFGEDTWTFTAQNSGTGTLTITAARGSDVVTMFSNNISVE